jgi:hypothetical protein
VTEHITDAAVDRWLSEHHAQFVNELANRLDLEAGLEEVLLGERHQALVEEVRSKLDLDAGLAAILPPAPEPLPAAVEDEVQAGSLPWVAGTLAEMPLQRRLKLRALYANELNVIGRTAVSLAQNDPQPEALEEIKTVAQSVMGPADDCSTAGTGDPDQGIVRWYRKEPDFRLDGLDVEVKFFRKGNFTLPDPECGSGSSLAEAWRDWYQRFVDGPGPVVQVLGKYSAALSGWTSTQPSPRRWAASVAAFICGVLDGDGSKPSSILLPTEVADRLHQVAGYVMFVEQMLNDFTDVDLRNVELAGIPLDGVRWSEATTQWPEEWRQEIERNSIPLGDGLFEIHYGTNTHTGRGSLV